jgi:hypothetical protein
MKPKTFDCVEMKQRGAALVQEKTAGMTPEQELEFWREQTEVLRQQQREVREIHSPECDQDPLAKPRSS